jgi:hypothetical protein
LKAISADMDVIENQSYHQLLLLFRGERSAAELEGIAGESVDRATIGYGMGGWDFIVGWGDLAARRFRAVVGIGLGRGFGHIAAEAELSRMR